MPNGLLRHFAIAVALALATLAVHASEDQTNYDEPGLNPGRDYIADHFAEYVDPFNGNLSLQFTDLILPGNGGLDIKVRRTYNSYGIGNLNSPFGRGWDLHFGRVSHRSDQSCAGAFAKTMALELPDGSSYTLHKSNGVAGTAAGSDYITANFWKGRCNASGTGITMFSPDGTAYDMSELLGGYWYVSRITDRFGNTLTFTYVTLNTIGQKAVSRIDASDGRVVTFSYASDRLSSISGGGQTWNYTVGTTSADGTRLNRVTLPNGNFWDFLYNANLGTSTAGSFLVKRVTNPYGGFVEYSYGFVNFIPGVVGWSPTAAVTRKQESTGGIWTYAYSPGCNGGGEDTTSVTLPNNIATIVYKHHGYCSETSGNAWKIGLLHTKSIGNAQTETYTWTWQTVSNESVQRPFGNMDSVVNRPLLAQKVISRDGTSYTTTYNSPDSFGNPQSISESGSASRTRSINYFNSASEWIVGIAASESNPAGSITRSINSSTGAVTSETRYGVTTSYGYNGDGTLSSKTNARGYTTTYGSYVRNIPQTENRPQGVTIRRVVNGSGFITSQSDGESTWGYGYDGMGRLTSINFPTGSDATINWGSTSRTLSRGAFTEITQLDAFGRVIGITRNNITTTIRRDGLGRKIFESYPGSSQGYTYTLDALGRVKSLQSPAGTKSYSYSSGGSVSVTNERGYTTRYAYDRYGDPDAGYLTDITTPESGTSISMNKNAIGVLLSATQGGVTRTYGRDSRFYLTSLNEPETGTTTFGRDGMGNMTSKSVGGVTVSYGYDGLDRLTSISGPASVTLGYDARGLVTSLSGPAGQRTYTYDANGNLRTDTLSIDGLSFTTTYSYDTIDGLSQIDYPMNKGSVTYAPDGLGRPTRASPYLTSVQHYGSGNLSSIAYANGLAHSYSENSRQLPSGITSNISNLVNLSYNYDNVGNVASISDAVDGNNTRSMSYDAIDRLTNSTGPWGSGSISYDGAGNITRQVLGTYSISYGYSNNRLWSLNGSLARSYAYDGRGNITGDGQNTFTYDGLSQLTCANCGAPNEVRYQYDGQGRRVSEQKSGYKTYFVQAPNGDLLFEYAMYGKVWTKHAYLHGKRIASETDSDANTTTTTLSANPTSPSYGTAVAFTATVTGGATGTVEFREGTQLLASALLSNGHASASVSTLAVGSHQVTANYLGDANFKPSASVATTVTVGKATPTVALTANPASGPSGTRVTLDASVSGQQPTGQVQFFDGGALIGTVALTNGAASFQTAALANGTHSFTATYGGDANNNSAGSNTATATIGPVTTLTTLSASPTSTTYTGNIRFTASVAPSSATGTVEFRENGTLLGTAVLSSGQAIRDISTLPAGTHNVIANYLGDANDQPSSSGTVTVTISQATTLTSLTASPTSGAYGTSIAFTASVAPSAATGTVEFREGGALLGSGTLSSGQATLNLSSLAVGTHSVVASYLGDANDGASGSAPVSVTISQKTASISLSASPATGSPGQTATLQASVSGVNPTGSVQFLDNGTPLGSVALTNGTATFTTSGLAGGTHNFTATYSGDTNNTSATSNTATTTISSGSSSTTLTASPSTVTSGQTVTFTASVTPASATGSVDFKEGTTVLGTSTLASGQASLAVSTLAVGTHSVVAAYRGDGSNQASTSTAVTVTVNRPVPSVTLSSSNPNSAAGAPVTFTATVSGNNGTATGNVTFVDGTTTLSTVALASGTASFTTSALSAGAHSMTAQYGGDSTYAAATSPAITQSVGLSDTSTSFTSKAAVYSNETLWVTVTVTGASPTGNVRLNVDGTQAASGTLSSGTVKLGVRGLSVAPHTVQAFYGGDGANNASASASQSVTIRKGQRPQDFNVDGQADLLWYRSSDGSATSWLMSGNQVDPSSPGFGTGPAGFELIHSGDFDGDGKYDLLWYRASDGMLKIQFKDGPTSDVGTIAAGWQLRAVADLDGDGKSDLLWLNTTTGIAMGWWMKGTQVASTPSYGNLGPNYDLIAAADFDGDGKADLLWMRSTDRQLTMQFATGATGEVGQIGAGYVLRGVGDMNGDGMADLFFFNASTGVAGGLWMNGATQDPNSRGFGTADPGYELVGVADFNGDGLADGLWYSASDGGVKVDLTTIDRLAVGTAPAGYAMRGFASTSAAPSGAQATTTSLSAVPSTSTYGDAITFTAAVAPSAATGTVQFTEGTQVLGSGTLSNGQASFATSALAAGTHSIVASYLGDGAYQASSSAAIAITVNKHASSVALSASPANGAPGTQATLTATVTGISPTGQVQFFDGATAIGTASLSGGTATFVTAGLSSGTHGFTASYLGDANNLTSGSNTATTTISGTAYTASVALSSSNASSTAGSAVTFTATVTGNGPAPTGNVTFLDGTTSLGDVALSDGSAALTTNALAVGSHSITARYNGNGNYAAVTSSVLTQAVDKADTTSTFTSKSAVYSNETLWVTVTVTGASPTGTVLLDIDGTQVTAGTLSGGTVKLGVRGLSIASHSVQVVYDGDASNNASTSATQSVAMRKGQRPQDFNVDGNADLLWYRSSDGSATSWLMNGNQVDPATPGFGTGPAGFDLIQSGDFDGDGKNDLLWYRASDGMLKIQFKDGPTSDVGTIAAEWQVKSTTDLNGDGKADLLWFNSTTGAAMGWWMNGTQLNPASPSYASPGAGYTVLAAADFDGDGRGEILWQRASDGDLRMQFPDGSVTFVAQISSPWVLRGLGDMNGDGNADIFIFNPSTGVAGGLWMNGAAQDPNSRGFGTADPGYELVGVADFNGDGLADALWLNASTGDVKMDLTTIDRFTVGPAPAGYVMRGLGSVIQ